MLIFPYITVYMEYVCCHGLTSLEFAGNNERGRMILNQTFTIGTFSPRLYLVCALNFFQHMNTNRLASLLVSSEPMLTIGSTNATIWSDDWTVVTEDGSLSAQFEHTLLITEDGVEILTQC